MPRIRTGALALAGLLALGGCSWGGEDPPANATGQPTAPDGYRLVTGEQTGLRLAVPDYWQDLTPEEYVASLQDDATSPAETAGDAKDFDLVVQHVEDGTIYVHIDEGADAVPSTNEVENLMLVHGLHVHSSHYLDTPIGPATLVEFSPPATTLPNGDEFQPYMAAIFASVDDQVVDVAVLALDGKRTRELLKAIVPSLHAAD